MLDIRISRTLAATQYRWLTIMTGIDDTEQDPSKSQRKRDMHELHDLGVQMVDLPPSQLKKLPLDEDLLAAILSCQAIHQRGGRKRQLKFIGKLLRYVDAEPIALAVEQILAPHRHAVNAFHDVEQWRDKLLSEGDSALADFLATHPGADRQKLRQLIRAGQLPKDAVENPESIPAKQHERAKRAKRELFKLLREILEQD